MTDRAHRLHQDLGVRPRIIAHRGASSECPENTLPAFCRALELGADGIELDVHSTSDGVVVVHHDPGVRCRSNSGATETREIAALTMHELNAVAAGAAERVPALEEVLGIIGDRAEIYIELKGHGIEHAVVDVIRRSPAPHRCAVHSFDHVAVLRSRLAEPAIPGGILLTSRLADPAAALRSADARDYWIHWTWADSELLDAIHGAGGRVIAWTPRDQPFFRALQRLGVDGICADDVTALRDALEHSERDS